MRKGIIRAALGRVGAVGVRRACSDLSSPPAESDPNLSHCGDSLVIRSGREDMLTTKVLGKQALQVPPTSSRMPVTLHLMCHEYA
jgi:hypothetical protein